MFVEAGEIVYFIEKGEIGAEGYSGVFISELGKCGSVFFKGAVGAERKGVCVGRDFV